MEATRKTVLSLERLEGFAPLMERVEAALSDVAIPTLILWGHPDAYFRDASKSVTEELLRFLS
jgi:hypothetical protein